MKNLHLSLALLRNSNSLPMIDGSVRADGIDFAMTVGSAGGEIFWRQMHLKDFDIAELSFSDMLMLVSHGDRSFVMLPVFMTRRFFHTNILVRPGAGIESPADLKGKRIGVQEYVQTANVWARGILQDEFGVPFESMHWLQERPETVSHTHRFGITKPTKNFSYISPDKTLGEMFAAGEVDAVITYSGRPNKLDRSSLDIRKHAKAKTLFANSRQEGIRYFQKTGIFPMNHAPVIRRSIVERHPWVVTNLYQAFLASKQTAITRCRDYADAHANVGYISSDARDGLNQDPYPYGLAANRKMLETCARYSHEQGLSPQMVALEEVFAEATLDS